MSASNVKWVRLGKYITQRREKNDNFDLPIRGVTRDGFIPPKQDGADTSLYNVFYKYDFVFNPARMELNSIYLNLEFDKAICSSLYEIFYVNRPEELLPEYLNLFIKREEFARYCWYDAIGSARNYFRVANMQDIILPLPSIEVQQELVDTYNGLKALAEQNEALIEPLSKACEAFIVDCKNKYPEVELGGYIEELSDKNKDGYFSKVLGLSTQKEFREPNSRVNKDDLFNYKIVPYNCFAYVPTTDTWKVFARAINKGEPIVVSPIYCVFKITSNQILPDFLPIIYKRAEFDRYARFNSWGSARENFNFSELCKVKIPLPPIEIQQSIVNLYNCLEEAKKIASEAREKLKTLCPALVQRAANS